MLLNFPMRTQEDKIRALASLADQLQLAREDRDRWEQELKACEENPLCAYGRDRALAHFEAFADKVDRFVLEYQRIKRINFDRT